MANIENALSEILDVLEHVVNTHSKWNVDLSHREAVVKLGHARLSLIATEDVDDETEAPINLAKDAS